MCSIRIRYLKEVSKARKFWERRVLRLLNAFFCSKGRHRIWSEKKRKKKDIIVLLEEYIMQEVWKGRKLLEQLISFWSNGVKDSDMKGTGVAKRREKGKFSWFSILHYLVILCWDQQNGNTNTCPTNTLCYLNPWVHATCTTNKTKNLKYSNLLLFIPFSSHSFFIFSSFKNTLLTLYKLLLTNLISLFILYKVVIKIVVNNLIFTISLKCQHMHVMSWVSHILYLIA